VKEKSKVQSIGLLSQLNQELVALIATALPSTVTIKGFSKDLAEGSQGSGWIYAPDLVVTNHHVIEGMEDPLTIHPVGRTSLQGKVIGKEPDNDIALLRVEGLEGQPLKLQSERPSLGELCVAIGSPLSYRESASFGIVSGLSRQIRNSNGTVIEEMIQTDASVNHGNSGGPLINMAGEVIGMNTLGPRETVNMAVPAETLAAIVPELEKHGDIRRASIGVSIAMVERTQGKQCEQAVSVKRVRDNEESPLQPGDIIQAINGREVRRRIDVIKALNREVIDTKIAVEVERGGKTCSFNVMATEWSLTMRQSIQ
jgi:S1-C subfamily serine protease